MSLDGPVANRSEVRPDLGDLRPLWEQIRDAIRARIVQGVMAPGSRVVEREIAAEHGISRAPVREAIRLLEAEGFVSVRPGRGVVVRELARKEVEDLFDLREVLEVFEARLAAERARPADVRRLRWLVDEARHRGALNELQEVSEANIEFHEEIARLADNSALTKALEPVAAQLRWNYAQTAEPERVLAEHEALLAAIAGHDADRAAEVALKHVREARRIALEAPNATR